MLKHKSGYWLGRLWQDEPQQAAFKLALEKLNQQSQVKRSKSILIRAALGSALGFPVNLELSDSEVAVLWQNRRKQSAETSDDQAVDVIDFYLDDAQVALLTKAIQELQEHGFRARHGNQRLQTAVIKKALKSYLKATWGLHYPYQELLPPVPQVDWAALATRLRGERDRLGYSQPELAETLNRQYGLALKATHISQMENQHRSKPSQAVVDALHEFFGWT